MGAKVACPDDDVVCLAGDGSLIMTVQELATCVDEQIPVKVFLMNNGYLGMVRQWQELFWDKRYCRGRWLQPGLGQARRGVRRHGHARLRQPELTDSFKAALTEGPVLVTCASARGRTAIR